MFKCLKLSGYLCDVSVVFSLRSCLIKCVQIYVPVPQQVMVGFTILQIDQE